MEVKMEVKKDVRFVGFSSAAELLSTLTPSFNSKFNSPFNSNNPFNSNFNSLFNSNKKETFKIY